MKSFDSKPRSKGLPLAVGDEVVFEVTRRGVRFVFFFLFVAFFLGFGCGIQYAHAETKADTWPAVGFQKWPTVTIAQLKDKEPITYTGGSYGAVTRKPLPPEKPVQYCNRQTPLGDYVRERC